MTLIKACLGPGNETTECACVMQNLDNECLWRIRVPVFCNALLMDLLFSSDAI